MLNEIDGVDLPRCPKGRSTPSPRWRASTAATIRGRTGHSSAELAELAIDEAKVAVVPGEAFGAPGYFRMSYALGDDDLVEGVSRLAKLFGERRSLSAGATRGPGRRPTH